MEGTSQDGAPWAAGRVTGAVRRDESWTEGLRHHGQTEILQPPGDSAPGESV